MLALSLNGSPRKGGNTDILSDHFLRGCAEAGAQTTKVYLDDLNIRPIAEVGDVWAERVDLRADDDFMPTLQRVIEADIVALTSPVYWQGVTAQMKCFVDRLSCFYAQKWFLEGMSGKAWAVLTAFGNPHLEEAEWITRPVKVWVGHFKGTYVGEVAVPAFSKGQIAENEAALQAAHELGRKAVMALREAS